jgi:hypothetical protein
LVTVAVVRTDANLAPILLPVGPKNSNQREIDGLTRGCVVRTDGNLVPIVLVGPKYSI